jgi:ADP-heptose:LPS heptosyltransferase
MSRLLAADPRLTDIGRHFGDFTDTAAAVALVDLVISVDTSVAHLAGALAKPVWVLLPLCPDWRWLTERDDSPWYPSARLFRQPAIGDWESVIEQVRGALAQRAGG